MKHTTPLAMVRHRYNIWFDKPVYEEDGSAAHVSWCPCYPCTVERETEPVAHDFDESDLALGREQ